MLRIVLRIHTEILFDINSSLQQPCKVDVFQMRKLRLEDKCFIQSPSATKYQSRDCFQPRCFWSADTSESSESSEANGTCQALCLGSAISFEVIDICVFTLCVCLIPTDWASLFTTVVSSAGWHQAFRAAYRAWPSLRLGGLHRAWWPWGTCPILKGRDFENRYSQYVPLIGAAVAASFFKVMTSPRARSMTA